MLTISKMAVIISQMSGIPIMHSSLKLKTLKDIAVPLEVAEEGEAGEILENFREADLQESIPILSAVKTMTIIGTIAVSN